MITRLYWLKGAESCTSWENGVSVRGNGHDAETLLLPEANPISHMDRSDLDLLTFWNAFHHAERRSLRQASSPVTRRPFLLGRRCNIPWWV